MRREQGARVILAEADAELGGALLRDEESIDGEPALAWVQSAREELGAAPETIVLTSTVASLLMDQNGMWLAQRVGALLPESARGALPEQRLWHVRARHIVLATGALERPIVFPDNDRPGIMLASAARSYLVRHALAPARGVVFTNNDDAWRTAIAWHSAGVEVGAVVDMRGAVDGGLPARVRALGIPTMLGARVIGTQGDAEGRLTGVTVRSAAGDVTLDCDLLAVSGGHDPNLNLHLQLRGGTRYDESIAAAVPTAPLAGQSIVGAARGARTLGDCVRDGAEAARAAREGLGDVRASGVAKSGITTEGTEGTEGEGGMARASESRRARRAPTVRTVWTVRRCTRTVRTVRSGRAWRECRC